MREDEKKLLKKIRPHPKQEIYIEPSFVVCKICGAQLKTISNTHLLFKHEINRKEYLDKFPNAEMQCTGTLELRSEIAKKMWADDEYKENMKIKLKVVLNTPEQRKLRSDNAKRLHSMKNSPYHTDEYLKGLSERATKKWEDPEFREKMIKINQNLDPVERLERNKKQTLALKKNWANPKHTYNKVFKRHRKKKSLKKVETNENSQ